VGRALVTDDAGGVHVEQLAGRAGDQREDLGRLDVGRDGGRDVAQGAVQRRPRLVEHRQQRNGRRDRGGHGVGGFTRPPGERRQRPDGVGRELEQGAVGRQHAQAAGLEQSRGLGQRVEREGR
jgi:hypothetical protein